MPTKEIQQPFEFFFYFFFIFFSIIEVFSWLLEVANDTKDHHDNGRIVWSVSYVHDGPKLKDAPIDIDDGHFEENHSSGHRKKLIAKVDIQKDDIQAVLPISKASIDGIICRLLSMIGFLFFFFFLSFLFIFFFFFFILL